MSWRAFKFKQYNRKEELEEVNYWYQLLFQDDDIWDHFDEYGPWGINWWDYPGSGSVNSMDEYHQMHLLTLLRKFNIRTARQVANYHGW